MEKFFTQLEKFFITTPLLGTISRGTFFTRAFAWLLRILAALAVIGFIWFSVTIWITFARMMDFGDSNAIGFFFAVLFAQILAILLLYVAVNILLVRSNAINKLPLQTDYVVIPVAVQLIKMAGELYAVFFAIVGVFITIALLVTGGSDIVRQLIGGGGFGAKAIEGLGYAAFVIGPVAGFLILVFFYSVAELVGALVDIARNTKKK